MASEHFYFWLNSLKEFSQAEQYLSHVADGDYSGAMSAIAEALRSYQKGIASLTVSSLQGICLSKVKGVVHPKFKSNAFTTRHFVDIASGDFF